MNAISWALLSAGFAGLTALFVKLGTKDVNPNLATAIRTSVVLLMAWGIVLARGEALGLKALPGRTWLFLCLSGLATGGSWLCYFRALASGSIAKVAPIDKLSFVIAVALGVLVLREKVTWPVVGGCALIVAGVLLTLKG